MPSPPTSKLPVPKSWEEFEDICTDLLGRLWDTPYVTRNGRTGQEQNGVDIYGTPAHLSRSTPQAYAGAQCKNTPKLSLKTVEAEVEKAKSFRPKLAELIMMSTAPRDATLQEQVRTHTWPFRVEIMFWEDICLELSSHNDLLLKHFPNWFQDAPQKSDALKLISTSEPENFDHFPRDELHVLKSDIRLRLQFDRNPDSLRDFDEPWVRVFPDKHASKQRLHVYFDNTKILEVDCVHVDGGRFTIPMPDIANPPSMSSFRFHLGRILNPHDPAGYDRAIQRAKIKVI